MTKSDTIISVGLVGIIAFLIARGVLYQDMLSMILLVPVGGLLVLFKVLTDRAHVERTQITAGPEHFEGANRAVNQAAQLLNQSTTVAARLNRAMEDIGKRHGDQPQQAPYNWLDAIPPEYRDGGPDYGALLGGQDDDRPV